jgi:hypothetical protein
MFSFGSVGLGRVPSGCAISGIGSGSTNCARVLTSSAAGIEATTPDVDIDIAFASTLLPVASVVANKLDRCRNFRRVITKYLSRNENTATASRVMADSPHLTCRYPYRDFPIS